MERFARMQVHELSLEDIQKIADEEITKGSNPCLDKLVYIETRAKGEHPRKIFPAYPFSVMDGKDGKVVVVFMVQYIMRTYTTACITFAAGDIGVTCRFWNLPPTDEVMDAVPMVDASGVQ